jgi:hypothetical protein
MKPMMMMIVSCENLVVAAVMDVVVLMAVAVAVVVVVLAHGLNDLPNRIEVCL